MYCPKCATPLADEQKFCRSCGLDLQEIAQLLSRESEADELAEAGFTRSERAQSQKARLRTLGTITLMLALMIGCLIPISLGLFPNWAGIYQLILILSGLAGLPLFAGVILLVYADALPDLRANKESIQLKSLQRAVPTNQLPPVGQAEAVPSAVERTTDLLQTVEAKDSRKHI
jgi:hypothetical protein